MLLAINIGNDTVNFGVFDGSELKCSFDIGADRGKTADEYAMQISSAFSYKRLSFDEVTEAIIGSVVPALTERIEKAVSELFGVTPVTVRPGVKTGFKIRLNDPAELGADIAADAVGAIAVCGAPVIVCHMGEVSSITAVDGEKTFLGGALLPGIGMSLAALSRAALLPTVTLASPRSPLGKNTAECMNAGVIYGQAAAIREISEAYRSAIPDGAAAPLVITGEYAERIGAYLDIPHTVIPHLTLMGLREIAENNPRKKRG